MLDVDLNFISFTFITFNNVFIYIKVKQEKLVGIHPLDVNPNLICTYIFKPIHCLGNT